MSGMKIIKGKHNILIRDCCSLSQIINDHGDLFIKMWNLQYHENLVEAFPNNWKKKQFMPSRSKIWDRINRTSNASWYWSCGKELIARNILNVNDIRKVMFDLEKRQMIKDKLHNRSIRDITYKTSRSQRRRNNGTGDTTCRTCCS